MNDLITWLRAQLDDDERVTQACAEVYPAPWDMSDRGHTALVRADEPDFRIVAELEQSSAIDGWLGERLEHIARWDPARVLAEVDAKRRILDMWADAQSAEFPDYWGGYATALDDVVRQLALPYADRPGFRAEWRPR
ncbi:MAG TPA: DUF6221 family protein [Pseudonocardiaceae bacterium]|jgi:hypothetical protein